MKGITSKFAEYFLPRQLRKKLHSRTPKKKRVVVCDDEVSIFSFSV
jgi:hypothetical protein